MDAHRRYVVAGANWTVIASTIEDAKAIAIQKQRQGVEWSIAVTEVLAWYHPDGTIEE